MQNPTPLIGMTEKPEIGAVSHRMKMLQVPVRRPESDEVAIELRASAMHIAPDHKTGR